MSRFLFFPWPAAGDVMPLAAVAIALRDRGHRVAMFGPETVSRYAAAAGIECLPASEQAYSDGFAAGRDDGDAFAAVPRLTTEALDAVRRFEPDAITDGVLPLGTRLAAEAAGVPCASICATGCQFPGEDLFPYGMGLPPASDPFRRALLRAVLQRHERACAMETARWSRIRESFGLSPAAAHPWFGPPSPWLNIVPTTPEFEYPRPDLPPQVHFVGSVFWDAPFSGSMPDVPDDGRPLVFLSQGNTFNRDFRVMRLALSVLADEPVHVLAATGRDPLPGELGEIPVNAIVRRGFPFAQLFPRLSLAITHAGFSSVHAALRHGTPMVLFPFAADQPENAQRVTTAGAGLRLSPETCTADEFRTAVRTVLSDPRFAANARRLRDGLSRLGGPPAAAVLLEQLASTRQPVIRSN